MQPYSMMHCMWKCFCFLKAEDMKGRDILSYCINHILSILTSPGFDLRTFFLSICILCSHLHPGKPTWNLKKPPWQRRSIYEPRIFAFDFSFFGCTCGANGPMEVMMLCPCWMSILLSMKLKHCLSWYISALHGLQVTRLPFLTSRFTPILYTCVFKFSDMTIRTPLWANLDRYLGLHDNVERVVAVASNLYIHKTYLRGGFK